METATKNLEDKGIAVKGIVTFTNFVLETVRAKEIAEFLKNAHDIAPSVYDQLIAELSSICKTRQLVRENLVVLSGRSMFARRLVGDTTYTGIINYGALGTDDTAPNASDTTLNTEVARKLFARRTRTNAQVNFDFFYSQADTDGTYEEFGLFVDGTATADSGQLFNRVLTGGWVKTSIEAMTVSVQVNINAS